MIGVKVGCLWLAKVQGGQRRVDLDDRHLVVNETTGLRNLNGGLLLVARKNPNLKGRNKGRRERERREENNFF